MVSFSWPNQTNSTTEKELTLSQAEEILQGLAGVFSADYTPAKAKRIVYPPEKPDRGWSEDEEKNDGAQLPNLEARYRALVEQIPAVVFMAYLDRGIGEA